MTSKPAIKWASGAPVSRPGVPRLPLLHLLALPLPPRSNPRTRFPNFLPPLPPKPPLWFLRPAVESSRRPRAPGFPSSRRAPRGPPPYLQGAEQRAERQQRGRRATPPGARGHGAEGRAGRRAQPPLLPAQRCGRLGASASARPAPAAPRPAPIPAPPGHLSPPERRPPPAGRARDGQVVPGAGRGERGPREHREMRAAGGSARAQQGARGLARSLLPLRCGLPAT